MIKIGNKTIKTNVFLAPMSGCTDLSFRLISRELGAKFCFYEMLDASALLHNLTATLNLLKTTSKDKPIAAQLLGAKPDQMLEAALKLTSLVDISFLDINSACPAKKVVSKGAGASLPLKPKNMEEMLKKLTSSLSVPITVKLRLGYTEKNLAESINIVKMCQDNGVSAIFMHGRTRDQGYSGDIDYKYMKAVRDVVKIPFIASGNVFDGQTAKKMFDETGCDGILAARGALGNPWIFKEIEYYLKHKKVMAPPSLAAKKKYLKKHLGYIKKYKETHPDAKIGFMRKVAMWYIRGLPDAARLRHNICGVKKYTDLIDLIDGI